MPRVCTICTHRERRAIDAAVVAGEAIRGIARQFRVSDDAVSRHRAHVAGELREVQAANDAAAATDLATRLREMVATTHVILGRALKAEEDDRALRAIDRLVKLVDVELRMQEIDAERTNATGAGPTTCEPRTPAEHLAELEQVQREIADAIRHQKEAMS